MISSLILTNFKNFANESIRIGPFTVIVGVNATGKSNLRDAFRFLHGVGRNYTLAEIVGGKTGAGGQREWEPIRGGTNELIRFGCESFTLRLGMQVDMDTIEYNIEVGKDASSADRLRVVEEYLWVSGQMVYDSHPDDDPIQGQDDDAQLLIRLSKTGSQKKYGSRVAVSRDKPVATQLYESHNRSVYRTHKSPIRRLLDALQRVRFLEPSPEAMRKPTVPGMNILGDRGENLPAVLMNICGNQKHRSFIADWICELTPMDVKDFEFLKDPSGLIHLMIRDGDNNRVSAYSASDGTLRFLSMLAILFDKSANFAYFFEEIDSGIHPSRIQLLLNLIEAQTKIRNVQVLTTTHSPILLSMLSEKAFEYASIIARIGESSDAIIRPLSKLHRIEKLRASQGLARLLTSGWMEDALTFTEGSEDPEESL